MLRWISTRFTAFVERACERDIARLEKEKQLLKAELEILKGGTPIVLPEEGRARLRKAAEKNDPEDPSRICVVDLGDIEVHSDESRRNSS